MRVANTPSQTNTPRASAPDGRQHLRAVLYRLGDTEFATDVKQVQEIVRPTRLAKPAKLLDKVEGLIRRRGRLVPIVDLRKQLRLPVDEPTPETCAVITLLPIGPVGFVVDAALSLRWIKLSDIETPATILATIAQEYIQGLAVHEGRTVVMLDLMRVLSSAEQKEIAGAIRND